MKKSRITVSLASLLILLVWALDEINGHGYLWDPPGRSSMWRFGYDTPKNYDDNAVYCGGFGTQYNSINQGRCGECGDEWNQPRPRDHEEGGKYWQNIIGQRWIAGNLVRATVLLTTSHKGYFEFRLCAKQSANELVSQSCFDRTLLTLADGSTRYPVTASSGWYDVLIRVPSNVVCDYCVVQWTYTTGNNWGNCGNGTSAVGCGNQETFRNCADITVVRASG